MGKNNEQVENVSESVKAKIPELLEAVESLKKFVNADNGWYSGESDNGEGESTWNHWSGGLVELKKELKRDLTNEELSLYSLSLNYGPMPSFSDEEARFLNNFLWPKGNQTGGFSEPDYIKEKLSKLL